MARAPSIFREIVDVNPDTIALTGNDKILIKYHSDAKATMNPFPFDGAAINLDTLVMRNGNQTANGSEIPFSHTFRNVSSNEFVFSCLDSNGMTGTAKDTVEMIEYIKPTCYIRNAVIAGNGDFFFQCGGTWFNDTFGAESNELTVLCRYAIQGESAYTEWQNMDVTQNGNSYVASRSITNLDYEKNYVFQVKVEDKLETAKAEKIISSVPIFHWGKDDFVFEVPVYANGGIYINGEPMESGKWEPDLTVIESQLDEYDGLAVLSSEEMTGWYCKVGNSVTVGFYIKVNCDSGYQDFSIAISGLPPYDPIYPSAGGGMCSGAFVSADHTFQCFVAETNGTITTRVQESNNTTNAVLDTSASGCNYRKTNGEITLSGTITYLTD